jgi:hypothetical protein
VRDLLLQVERCSYEELHEHLQAFQGTSRPEVKRRLVFAIAHVAGVLVAVFALALSVEAVRFLVPFATLVTLIYGFVRVRRVRRLYDRLGHKLAFVQGLAARLRDDLNPRAPMRVRLDLRGYEHPSKLERTARSSAGRKKEYFSDKWLHLRFVLAEGSAVEIVRQAGVKEKSGSVVSEKRRLAVSVRPNPARYGDIGKALTAALATAAFTENARRGFPNAPEVFGVRATEGEGVVTVRVTQHDADFAPEEVVALLGCILREAARLAPRAA